MTDPKSTQSQLVPATLWTELGNAAAKGSLGWRLIRCRATPGRSLFAALDPVGGRRALLLPLPNGPTLSRRQWPRISGLDTLNVSIGGELHAGIALKEHRFADVFDALMVDLSRRVELAPTAKDAFTAFLGQLLRWQRFLKASSEGLSVERQQGLWGELHFLNEHLIPKFGATLAVLGWKGPERSHQDFQFFDGAIEVKTTTAKQPQSVRITSERQLDDSSWTALFLHVLILDKHEGAAFTLPQLIKTIRTKLVADVVAQENFEEALLSASYLDIHTPRYEAIGYTVRAEHWFRVTETFPRIIETSLPSGVGDVSYSLNLSACDEFRTTAGRTLNALAS